VQVLGYVVPGWGRGELWVDGERVLAHELPRPRASSRPRAAVSSERSAGHVSPLQQRVLAYFGGERDEFRDVELDLEWCTPFQRAVAEALRTVPYGETVTYGELAALAGHSNAHRAAGSFCAGNRFGLFVPCHRVVAAGSLGSYGSLGVEYKRRLLALEGATAVPRCRGPIDPNPTEVIGAADAP
jgi:methylated-DNA-[protein]-cysteine S-methyltransferase